MLAYLCAHINYTYNCKQIINYKEKVNYVVINLNNVLYCDSVFINVLNEQ